MPGDAVVSAAPANRSAEMSRLDALSILLVDDEIDLLAEVARYLRRRGHQVDTTASYPEAEALIDTAAAPDVLITDVRMPGGTGLDLARRARQRHPRCRVVVMTGHLEQDHIGTADDLCDVAVLFKPFSFSRLLARVNGMDAPSDGSATLPIAAPVALSSVA